MSRNNILVSNNNTNRISTNPLSISSTLQRRVAIRRRWESFRRNHQSADNTSRGNITTNTIRANDETFTERDTDHNNTLELNIGANANSDNNLAANGFRQQNLSNNITDHNNNFNKKL